VKSCIYSHKAAIKNSFKKLKQHKRNTSAENIIIVKIHLRFSERHLSICLCSWLFVLATRKTRTKPTPWAVCLSVCVSVCVLVCLCSWLFVLAMRKMRTKPTPWAAVLSEWNTLSSTRNMTDSSLWWSLTSLVKTQSATTTASRWRSVSSRTCSSSWRTNRRETTSLID